MNMILSQEIFWRKMFKILSKSCFLAMLALVCANSLMAEEYFPNTTDDCCYASCNRMYVGAFGGGLYSDRTRLTQTGVAFFTEAEGGPLAVDARGKAKRTSSGFGGVQIGYEWRQSPIGFGCNNWNITPGAELEAYFYSHKKRGDLINPTNRLPEHDFRNRFPMNVQVYLVNGVFTFNNCCWESFSPYVGGGIGAARICINRARSLQVSPPEAGINHFNSDRSDSAWTFAAQAKAGIRYNFCERFHIFAEYRFSFVDSSRYVFGSTVSPNHVPTTTWNVDVKDMCYNAFAIGIQFDL